jgi:GNAT superfamily N-acetyltransferase
LDGLAYRHIEVEERAGGRELEDAFRADGWDIDHELVMALDRPPVPPDDGLVIEPSEERMLELMRRWIAEQETPHPGPLGQHVESVRRRARASGERHFGIEDSAGRLVAMTNLRSDGTIAQVENVYTAPEARGRGYARTLVAYVAALAAEGGRALTFITADANDWPKDLYGRLGFKPIGLNWVFHRQVEEPGSRRGGVPAGVRLSQGSGSR